MIQIAAWLIGWKAKAAVIAGGLMALLALRAWDVSRQQAKGAAKVIEASKQVGAKANAKNDEVRRAASAPGAAERLRRESCRDC